jgi:hypothetical protein
MDNAIDSARISAAERLDEVAEVIAAGVLRLHERRTRRNANHSNALREVPLDLAPGKSVCRHEPHQTREGR